MKIKVKMPFIAKKLFTRDSFHSRPFIFLFCKSKKFVYTYFGIRFSFFEIFRILEIFLDQLTWNSSKNVDATLRKRSGENLPGGWPQIPFWPISFFHFQLFTRYWHGKSYTLFSRIAPQVFPNFYRLDVAVQKLSPIPRSRFLRFVSFFFFNFIIYF